MLAGLLLLITVTLRWWPETSAARWIQRMLVDATRARLATLERRHLILLVLIPIMLIAGAEMLAMLGSADLAMFVLLDMASYIDIVLTGVVVATATRTGASFRAVRRLVLPRRATRARRSRLSKTEVLPANDDERPKWVPGAHAGGDCHGLRFG